MQALKSLVLRGFDRPGLTGICWSKVRGLSFIQGLWVACYFQQRSAQLETICGSIEGGSRDVDDVDSLAIKQTAMYGELGFLSTLQGVKLSKGLQRGQGLVVVVAGKRMQQGLASDTDSGNEQHFTLP